MLHHHGKVVVDEALVNGHEFSDEGFQVKDDFAAETDPMLVVGCNGCDFSFQLSVAIFQDFFQQFLYNKEKQFHKDISEF